MNLLSTLYVRTFLWVAIGICSACEDPEPSMPTNKPKDMRIELAESDAVSLVLDDEDDASELISEDLDPTNEDHELDPEIELNKALKPSDRDCLGPWMCNGAQGCHEGVCGLCANSGECPHGFVCPVQNNNEESESGSALDLGNCQSCDDEVASLRCADGLTCAEGRCVENRLQVFSVEVSEANWDLVRAERYESGLEVPCRVQMGYASPTFDGMTAEDDQTLPQISLAEDVFSCKLRVHGGSSRDLRKLSWRLILNERQEQVAWGGKHVILRAEYNDLSVMRNVLSLQLFHDWSKIPTPRWRYVWFKVNGQDMGLFLNVERHTNRLIKNWGRDDASPRYEADPNLMDNLLAGASALVSLPSQQTYWSAYDLKAGSSYQPLINFIENRLGAEPRVNWKDPAILRLAPHFQWGDYLQYLSIMTVIQNLDHIRKNFIISRQMDTDGQLRWEVYPWDLDLSWGCLYTEEYLSLCEELTYDFPIEMGRILDGAPPSYPTDGLYNTLIERSLTPPLALSHYEELLCNLTQDLDQNPTMNRIFAWQEALRIHLRPWVELDESSRHESSEDFDRAVDELREFWRLRRDLIRNDLSCP